MAKICTECKEKKEINLFSYDNFMQTLVFMGLKFVMDYNSITLLWFVEGVCWCQWQP